jgi:hypothetical protein
MPKQATKKERPNEYQGWANYATWACALWINNEQEAQEYWHERAKQVEPIDNEFMAEDRRKVHGLAEELKAHFEERAEEWMGDQASFFSDLFNHALAHVDWIEIAERIVKKVDDT